MIFDMAKSLEGKPIVFYLSDPWELGEKLGWKLIDAVVLFIDGSGNSERLLLKLVEPLEYNNVCCEYFIALPRYEGDQFKNLESGKKVFSGLTRISEEQIDSPDPFDLSWWRGGPALIGDLALSVVE